MTKLVIGNNKQVGVPAALVNTAIMEIVQFQAPTAQNNYTWYKKYSNNWVEQGGYGTPSTGACDISFPVTMSDVNYHVTLGVTQYDEDDNTLSVGIKQDSRTTSGMRALVRFANGDTAGKAAESFWWEVKGFASSNS